MFFPDLNALLDAGASSTGELDLVVEKIDYVIAQIGDQELEVNPEAFAFGASVRDGSFGRADSSPNLSHHYGRAHEVTWKTLRGVRQDLERFREACIAARDAITTADEDAADGLRAVDRALERAVAVGHGRDTRHAHHDAQQNQDTSREDV